MLLKWCWAKLILLLLAAVIGTACNDKQDYTGSEEAQNSPANNLLLLPQVEPVQLGDRQLRVVATTSIIGDVMANVGGEGIDLTTLMAYDQDPHSFEPGASVLMAVSEADVIFVNGWDLEEGLVTDLATIAGETPVVAVGANIIPLFLNDSGDATEIGTKEPNIHRRVDPHTWLSVQNVEQWVANITQILGDLDPDNTTNYKKNAQSYLLELDDIDKYLHEQIASIPVDKRILVTNHGVFSYFAQEYGFRIIGTVLPSTSTQAEPSAGDLAELILDMEESGACTIFTDIATNDNLAQTVASELNHCDEVKVIPLYTGALGPQGSASDSYIGMLRVNVDRIVDGLN